MPNTPTSPITIPTTTPDSSPLPNISAGVVPTSIAILTPLPFVPTTIPTSSPRITSTPNPPPPVGETELQTAIIAAINTTRSGLGLGNLNLDTPLQNEAKRYAGVLANKFGGCRTFLPAGTEPHAGVDGTNPFQRWSRSGTKAAYWGEVIAIINDDPDTIVAAWMASPGHRKAITGASAKKIGLGRSGSCTVGMIGI